MISNKSMRAYLDRTIYWICDLARGQGDGAPGELPPAGLAPRLPDLPPSPRSCTRQPEQAAESSKRHGAETCGRRIGAPGSRRGCLLLLPGNNKCACAQGVECMGGSRPQCRRRLRLGRARIGPSGASPLAARRSRSRSHGPHHSLRATLVQNYLTSSGAPLASRPSLLSRSVSQLLSLCRKPRTGHPV